MEMMVDTEHEFAAVFDELARAGGVVYFTFVVIVAQRCDALKFPNAKCHPKPHNDHRGQSPWKLRDKTWGNAANRTRPSVEARMLDFQPPRVFVASGVGQGTTGSGGVLPLPLPPLIINYHGRKPYTYHPEDHVVKHIKIFIREIRPCRFHNCQKNDYDLVVEANLSDYTSVAWVELHSEFVQLDHIAGRSVLNVLTPQLSIS
jgi:hypothetical protein